MAKAMTTITDADVKHFIETATYRKELPCEKIHGFHLQKLAKGATWRYRYTGVDNKRRIINIGKVSAVDRVEAAREATKLRNDVDAGNDPIFEREKRREAQRAAKRQAENSLLSTYWKTYYTDTYKSKRDGQASINRIHYHFHVVHDLFDRPMESLTKQDIHMWQRKCWDFVCPVKPVIKKTKKPNRKSLSHQTVQRAFNALKTLLNQAVNDEVIGHNPLANVKLLDPPSVENEPSQVVKKNSRVRRMLTDDELSAIRKGLQLYREKRRAERLRSADKGRENSLMYCKYEDDHPDWFFPFFELAAYTGIAPGDLYSLTWEELNLNFKKLTFVRNKTFNQAKNAGKEALQITLDLSERILNIMRIWHRQQGKPDTGLVFPSERKAQRGRPNEEMSADSYQKHWRHTKELGGIDYPLDFYCLRHHFISKRVSAGIPTLFVARLVGHRSAKMIEEHYGHLAPDALKDAMREEMDDFKSSNDPSLSSLQAL